MTSNMVMDYLYTHWSYLLTSLNQSWLSPDNLETFADVAFFSSWRSFAESFLICRWNGQTCFPIGPKSKSIVIFLELHSTKQELSLVDSRGLD